MHMSGDRPPNHVCQWALELIHDGHLAERSSPELGPSRPSLSHGAPDIGSNWAWNWGNPEGRPATWNASGEPNNTEDTE